GLVLTANAVNAYNSFAETNKVKPVAFNDNDVKINEKGFTVTLPSASVLRLSLVCADQ
ncbi:MAG TPA: hypothetical protein DDZ55_09535, partial [Firmicutes bacterium]|nr:hypothetical protein [Bacillota bacterium]